MEFEKIRKAISDILGIDENDITLETEFVKDLGADSLDVIEIVFRLEEEFGITIPDDAVSDIVTVGDAVEQINNAI